MDTFQNIQAIILFLINAMMIFQVELTSIHIAEIHLFIVEKET